jgi:hypothetical protein
MKMGDIAGVLSQAQDMFTRVYELMLSAQRGVCILDITLMDRPGELGRVLTKISEKTGAELLLSYAYADTRSKIGHAILIYECGGGGSRIIEAAREGGAIVMGAYYLSSINYREEHG